MNLNHFFLSLSLAFHRCFENNEATECDGKNVEENYLSYDFLGFK